MKSNYYFTFGLKYRDEPHPLYSRARPDGWVRILATNEILARRRAFSLFGEHWAFCYPELDFEAHWFPAGEIESFETI